MAVNLSPVGGVAGQFFDNNGDPLVGGKLFTYAAGTTTPQVTYTSSSGATPNSNPIILNAGGRVPSEIWLTDGLVYKFVLYTSTDQLIGAWDNIVGINSNFVNFVTSEEVQTATAGQTVFTLTTMQYQPGINNLVVYVDGVNQVEGGTYSFVETNSTTVTFTAGLHLGAIVKFVSAETLTTVGNNAALVAYEPAGTGAVATTVQAKLRETVSVKDFGAVGDGVTDDTAAIQAALDYQLVATSSFTNATNQAIGTGPVVFFPEGRYVISSTLNIKSRYAWLAGEQSTINKATVFTGTVGLQMANNAFRIHIESLQFADFEVGVYLNSDNLNSGQIGIHNCGFFGCTDYGLWLDAQSTATMIKDCMFRSNKHDLYIERGDYVVLEGGWIQRRGGQLTDDYDGSIINFGGLFAKNVVGVPQPETVVEPAWIINHGSVDCENIRFGGEDGQMAAVNNFRNAAPFASQTDKRIVSLRTCFLYVGANTPAIRLFFVPNLIVLDNNFGLTGSLSFAVGWSSSVSAPDQALRLPTNATQSQFFQIFNSNTGRDVINDANLLNFATTKRQLRLNSIASNTQNVIFDYLQETILTGDIYGTIEWKGLDASSPANVGRRGAIIGRSSSTLSGFELAFLTGISNGAVTERLVIQDNGVLRPAADNTQQLGTASFRWSEVFAGAPAINTSDGREKQDVYALDDAERRVAVALKGLVKKFRFKNAVERKGNNARIHVGVVAQEVITAFENEGLNPMQYGIVCYDKWEATFHDAMETKTVTNDDGVEEEVRVPTGERILVQPAGDRYGIRYEELLAFIIAAL